MSRLFEELVKKRGLSSDFLSPKYLSAKNIHQLLPDIEKATTEIIDAIDSNKKIMIYGDYDVDGVTATTVMADTLKLAGLKPENLLTMLPDRFIDGYGMSERCVKKAKDEKIDLIITVDCGSNNSEVISKLNDFKVKTIVTDHHEIMKDLPKAEAVVNPKRTDISEEAQKEIKNSGLIDLAGVGVAFMVALALVEKGRIKDGQEKWLLDLVLIGTLCDSMKISKINRELTYYGLKVLTKTRRKGLIELMHTAKISRLNSESIGFQIGPRLNAGGRIKSAEISLKLLMEDSKTEAVKLATKLNELNEKRRNEQQSAVKEISEEKSENLKDDVIVVSGKWHEGVLGIIAGRLVEKYHKPAFVLSKVKDIYKGSGRSFGDFNLADALKNCKDDILGGGGHAGACGLSLKPENLKSFTKNINSFYKNLNLKNQERFLKTTADLENEKLNEFSIELLDELKTLEPFGEGNEEPKFKTRKLKVFEARKVGKDENHLRLVTVDENNNRMTFVAFSAPKAWLDLKAGENLNLTFSLMRNEWNGRIFAEGRLLDVEKCDILE